MAEASDEVLDGYSSGIVTNTVLKRRKRFERAIFPQKILVTQRPLGEYLRDYNSKSICEMTGGRGTRVEPQKILWLVGIATEILLLGVTSRRGIGRRCPTFLIYTYWAVFNDLGAAVYYYSHGKDYLSVYGIQVTFEGLIVIAVLFDLARLAVRPLPKLISRGVIGAMGLIAIGAGALVWRLSNSWVLVPTSSRYHFFLREQLTFSLVRVLLLLLIGGLVELLSRHHVPVGWGERELQIATGMGIYALTSVAQSLGTTYQSLVAVNIYMAIALAVGIIYEICIVYWIVCFLRPDPVRADQKAETMEGSADSGPSTLWHKELTEFSMGIAAEK